MVRSNLFTRLHAGSKRFTGAVLLALACAAGMALVESPSPVQAFPKPSIVPVSWELKFTHSLPKRIIVTEPGSTVPVAYWYMTFTFTNQTDTEQPLLPEFEMVTKDGTAIGSDRSVPAAAFDTVKKRERNKNLEQLDKIKGRILIGEDQSREGVAIWREPDTRMGSFQIFVAGISGESILMKDGEEQVIKDWTKVSKEDREKLKTMRKTLQLNYQIPGDEIKPEEDTVIDKGEEWLMR